MPGDATSPHPAGPAALKPTQPALLTCTGAFFSYFSCLRCPPSSGFWSRSSSFHSRSSTTCPTAQNNPGPHSTARTSRPARHPHTCAIKACPADTGGCGFRMQPVRPCLPAPEQPCPAPPLPTSAPPGRRPARPSAAGCARRRPPRPRCRGCGRARPARRAEASAHRAPSCSQVSPQPCTGDAGGAAHSCPDPRRCQQGKS
jgi:hypothetical protein